MKDLFTAALALWNEAFPGEDPAFTDALFSLGYPDCFHYLLCEGELACMLFALPYPIVTEQGPRDARYLYAVATAKAHRGKGFAKKLLQQFVSKGQPVFLRPMSPSLFDFYQKAGLSPLSPYLELSGIAGSDTQGITDLSPREYLAARERFLTPPYCRMTPEFLSIAYLGGGAIGADGHFAALYERRGERILFKEWWGDPELAPGATAYLGASAYTLRKTAPDGTPFGMGCGVAKNIAFLAALD